MEKSYRATSRKREAPYLSEGIGWLTATACPHSPFAPDLTRHALQQESISYLPGRLWHQGNKLRELRRPPRKYSPGRIRSLISPAAALVKVTIKSSSIETGCSKSVIIERILATSTAVFPLPAAALTNTFAFLVSMTFCCSGVHFISIYFFSPFSFSAFSLSCICSSMAGIYNNRSKFFCLCSAFVFKRACANKANKNIQSSFQHNGNWVIQYML